MNMPADEEVRAFWAELSWTVEEDPDGPDEEAAVLAQLGALIDQGDGPHRRVAEVLLDMQERAGCAEPEVGAVRFVDFGDPERDPMAVLVAPGQVVVRPAEGGDGDGSLVELAKALGYSLLEIPDDSAGCAALQEFDARTRRLVREPQAEEEASRLRQDLQVFRGNGFAAAPNYVMPLGHLTKSDDYPRLARRRPRTAPPSECGPDAVRVAVIDTGILDLGIRTDGWLDTIDRDGVNQDRLDVLPQDDRLDYSAGHGSFVAGVIQQVAPEAAITMIRGTDTNGMGEEAVIARLMVKAACEGAQIIHLSLGTATEDNVAPPTMELAVELIERDFPDVLIVASAGNMGVRRPMWPAAFKQVVAVGATYEPARRGDLPPVAEFSNVGAWVDCSSVGVGIVSPFPKGVEPTVPGPAGTDEVFNRDGFAVWTGTSFSAPQITGMAARLAATFPGVPPRLLLEILLRLHGQDILGAGRWLHVLRGHPRR